jgi:ribosome biogenesis GTPase / thiamine phosphate phosphatase
LKLEGRVYRGSSGRYWVHVPGDPTEYTVRLKGTLKKDLVYSEGSSRPKRVVNTRKRRVTDPVTVGDLVVFDSEHDMIESVAPRSAELARKSPSSSEQHVLVANLDALFCVVAAAHPPPDLWIIDRFIVVAENQEIRLKIVVNKCDRVDNLEETKRLFAPYEKMGYPVYYTSAKQGMGIEDLREQMRGRVAAFAGNSGVGKSSLLNAIQPGLTLKTGDLSESTQSGKHTTTQAELIPVIDGESWLADTPGLRQLDFWQIDSGEVEYGFVEIHDRAHHCQFNNCTHRNEPGCAVLAAIQTGEVDPRRWRSYVELYEEAVTTGRASVLSGERSRTMAQADGWGHFDQAKRAEKTVDGCTQPSSDRSPFSVPKDYE